MKKEKEESNTHRKNTSVQVIRNKLPLNCFEGLIWASFVKEKEQISLQTGSLNNKYGWNTVQTPCL